MRSYRKGYRYEQKARKQLEAAGYNVIRSAGSKGPADLVAVKVTMEGYVQILYVQVKAVKQRQGWARELEQMRDELPVGLGITKELWCWVDRQWEIHTQ